LSNSYDDLLEVCRSLFAKPSEQEMDDTILVLRKACRSDQHAREALRRYIYEGDGRQRILAAEALSWTGEMAEDAVPVLTAIVEVLARKDNVSEYESWAVMGLGALGNYARLAAPAGPAYWPLLYKPGPLNVRLYATRLAARLATEGGAHWTIWCLLCRHEEEAVRKCARAEFKDWNERGRT
jgi:hypothetical protein